MQAIINITTRRCEDEEIHKNGFSFSSFHYHHVMLCFIFSVVDKKKTLKPKKKIKLIRVERLTIMSFDPVVGF
jgi:hypothetical protein